MQITPYHSAGLSTTDTIWRIAGESDTCLPTPSPSFRLNICHSLRFRPQNGAQHAGSLEHLLHPRDHREPPPSAPLPSRRDGRRAGMTFSNLSSKCKLVLSNVASTLFPGMHKSVPYANFDKNRAFALQRCGLRDVDRETRALLLGCAPDGGE